MVQARSALGMIEPLREASELATATLISGGSPVDRNGSDRHRVRSSIRRTAGEAEGLKHLAGQYLDTLATSGAINSLHTHRVARVEGAPFELVFTLKNHRKSIELKGVESLTRPVSLGILHSPRC